VEKQNLKLNTVRTKRINVALVWEHRNNTQLLLLLIC